MSKSRRHTITHVTVSKTVLCALCGALLLVGANPAHGNDRNASAGTMTSADRMRIDAGFGKRIGEKADSLDFVATHVPSASPVQETKRQEAEESVDSVATPRVTEARPSIAMFLRRNADDNPDSPNLASILGVRPRSGSPSSLSLHDFAYRPAKRTLVQRLGDSVEINFSLGTDHQLDPGHYEEVQPSIGLLLERKFR